MSWHCPRCGGPAFIDTGKGSKYRVKPWECLQRCGWVQFDDMMGQGPVKLDKLDYAKTYAEIIADPIECPSCKRKCRLSKDGKSWRCCGWRMDMLPQRPCTAELEQKLTLALAACKAAMDYIPGSEVRNWPPGFQLRDKALELLKSLEGEFPKTVLSASAITLICQAGQSKKSVLDKAHKLKKAIEYLQSEVEWLEQLAEEQ